MNVKSKDATPILSPLKNPNNLSNKSEVKI